MAILAKMNLRRTTTMLILCGWMASARAQDEDLIEPLSNREAGTETLQKKSHKRNAPKTSARKAEIAVVLWGDISGAKLWVDGKELKSLPSSAVTVSVGVHEIIVRRRGFIDFVQRVELKEGNIQEISATLQPVAGVVSVQADVPGAQISMDGSPMGGVPMRDALVPPGNHTFVIEKDGYLSDTLQVAIGAGKDYSLNAHLQPAPASR